jgi:glycosyltransferase involved in cell wall biosynthesis
MFKQKVKIVFFIDSFRIGGMHRQILYLSKHLDKRIFEPIVCTQSQLGGLLSEFKNSGCELIDLKWKGRGSFAILYRLIRALKEKKPDIIYITQAPNLVYFRLARLFLSKRPLQVGSFRALDFWLGHKGEKYQFIDKIISRWLYKTSDFIVVNSNALREHYSKLIDFDPKKPLQVIYNGCDFSFPISRSSETLREELGFHPSHFLIVMIARLDPSKDFISVMQAAKYVTQHDERAKFIIVGDGELKNMLEKLISELGIHDVVTLVGERKDVYNYINLCDISILSTFGEGFSNSILESMALSKPVIATNVGGNSELLGNNGECGILVPIQSPELMSEAILYLMENAEYRKQLGVLAKKRIIKICNINTYINAYTNFFLSMNGTN